MSCPHATTTTLLWIYGEADDDHLHHVADCEECSVAVAQHESVAALVIPAMPSVAAPVPIVPSAVSPSRRRWIVLMGPVALAAVALFAVMINTAPVSESASLVEPDRIETVALAPDWASDLDADLDELDYALDSLFDDLLTM